jgi:hypothetical protein
MCFIPHSSNTKIHKDEPVDVMPEEPISLDIEFEPESSLPESSFLISFKSNMDYGKLLKLL